MVAWHLQVKEMERKDCPGSKKISKGLEIEPGTFAEIAT